MEYSQLLSLVNLGSAGFFKGTRPFQTGGNCIAASLRLPSSSCAQKERRLPRLILKVRAMSSTFENDVHKDEPCLIKRIEKIENIRTMLCQSEQNSKVMVTVDALKKLGIDHYFTEEISAILDSSYNNMCKGNDEKLVDIALQFKLLREAGYNVSSDVFLRFVDSKGEFKQSLSTDLEGLMSLHEASFLNIGEEILYKANEFSTRHLKSAILKESAPDAGALVKHTLEHPYHMSLKQYKATYYLNLPISQRNSNASASMIELAQMEFETNQQLYKYEFMTITRWWKQLGLARELPFARDQVLKWYLWSMTVLPGLQFSKQRLELTKAVSFVYLIDDIYDIMGNAEELALFTQTINSWEESGELPGYMRACFVGLQDVTCGIARFVEEEYGWNPTSFLRRSWAALCNAFLVEARWFLNNQTPNAEEYLRNGVVSCGLQVLMAIVSFLLGLRVTSGVTEHLINGDSPLLSCPAKIVRLWDDLGSAKDENQEGYDGSYVKCYMKDNPSCSEDAAREHTKNLISELWEELNREYFLNASLHPRLAEASMNCARMVSVMYSYDEEQKLPVMNDYIQTLLLGDMKKPPV